MENGQQNPDTTIAVDVTGTVDVNLQDLIEQYGRRDSILCKLSIILFLDFTKVCRTKMWIFSFFCK